VRVDDFCLTTIKPIAAPSLGCNSVFAFITTSPTDQVKDLDTLKGFPSSIPVVGPTNIIIKPTFSGLFVPTPTPTPTVILTNTLSDAGAYTTTTNFWTGSQKDGTANGADCNGWTSSSPSVFGQIGAMDVTDTRYIDLTFQICLANRGLLCVCLQTTQAPTTPTNSPTV
jgi:hypothetical protein